MAGKLKTPKPQVAIPTSTPSAETISMFAPEGKFVQVPASEAGTLQAAGFQPDTPALRAQLANDERFGGLGGEIASAGLGVASGLTFGLSKPLLRKAGVPVDELEQTNPDAFLAGEIGSFIVPSLGTAGKVLGAGQRGVTAIGEAARKIVAKKLGEVGQGAVKMGVEGLVFGGANAAAHIFDDWVQDKDLAAEALLVHAGSTVATGLIGAGLGAAFPIIGKVTRKAFDRVGEQAKKFIDPQRSRQLFTGAMQTQLDATTGRRFQQAVQELGDDGLYHGGDVDLDGITGRLVRGAKGELPTQEMMQARLKDLKPKIQNAMTEKVTMADAAAASAGIKPAAAAWTPNDVVSADAMIASWRASRAIDQGEAEAMTAVMHDIGKGIEEAGGSLAKLRAIKQGLDARIGPKNFQSLKSEQIELVKELRRVVSTKIDDSMKELAQGGIPVDATAWRRLNRLYSNIKEIEKPLAKGVARANANVNVGGLRWRDMLASMGGASVGSAVGGPVGGAVGTLAGVANKAMQTDRGLLLRAELGEWLSQRTANMGKTWSVATSAMMKAAPIVEGEGLLGAAKLAEEWFPPLQAQLAQVASDPINAADALHADTDALREADPELADALVQKQLKIYGYLYEQMPKAPSMNVMGKPWKPTPSQLQKFAKVVRTAQDPTTIFADIVAGSASREQVKALQALYPSIHDQLVRGVMRALSEATEPVPYEAQLRISRLLGAPMSKYLRPTFIARMQALPSPSDPEADEKSGMGRVTLASENMQSEAQRVEARNIR